MIFSDFHTHTTFSDGKNTPAEMAEAAFRKGFYALGFSDHSYTAYDESYCLPLSRYDEYLSEIRALKEKYKGKLRILCGIEQDMYSDAPTDGFDYVIGSAHYLDFGGKLLATDESKEALVKNCEEYYDGDFLRLSEVYYGELASFIERLRPDIVGHFDYIARDNADGSLFDDSDPRYKRAWREAVDRIIKCCDLFEINTGCISRGYRSRPYPDNEMIEYIAERGGKFILTSDAHSAENICFDFERWDKFYEKFL